jgi:hypothetical protein
MKTFIPPRSAVERRRDAKPARKNAQWTGTDGIGSLLCRRGANTPRYLELEILGLGISLDYSCLVIKIAENNN